MPRLQAMGVLGASDETALTMLCVTWARWRDAVRVLRHCGEFYETIGSGWKVVVKRRPEAQIAKECESRRSIRRLRVAAFRALLRLI